MMSCIVKSLCLLFTIFAMNAYSYDVNKYYEVDKYFFTDEINDDVMCVGDVKNTCINIICLTSESRDCQDDCEKMAMKKCEVRGRFTN